MNKIRMLIIDDAPEALDFIKCNIDAQECDLEFEIDFETSFISENTVFDYDVYVIDDMFLGTSRSVDITREIREHDADAKVFIMSGEACGKTLRDLINLRVDGFIDKDDIEIEPLIKVCESIVVFKKQVKRLNTKMTKLFKM